MGLQCLYCLMLLAVIIAATTLNEDLKAEQFIKQSSTRYFSLYDQIAAETYSTTNDEDAFSKLNTVRRIASELAKISKESGVFDLNKIKNEESKHAIKELRRVGELFVLGEEYFSSVLINLVALQELAADKDIEPYSSGNKNSNTDGLPVAYYPDIQKIIQRSNDSEELKYYWESWREKNSIWASVNFYTIVESFQKAANIIDIPVLDLWYRYNSSDILKQMEQAMVELKPTYQQLHAFIRKELHTKYGANVIDPNGPIPDHLFHQVLEQTWDEVSIIDSYFSRKELPQYDNFVSHLNATALINEAEKFYTSLGFEALSTDFRQHQLKEPDEGKQNDDCRAAVFDLTPHVYVKYCEKVSFRKLMQNHGHMARVYYAQMKKNLKAYHFSSYDLEYSVGEAVILSATSPTHLTKIGLAQANQFPEKSLLNRLFRMGIHTILNIPLYYVHTKIMNDLLNGTIDMETVNKHYWKLMEQHAGIEPPVDRVESSIDFPFKFYVDLEQNHQTKKFVSEILGYQFYKALCQRSGWVGLLHNCDFYGNNDVGSVLKSMMSLGSSKPWSEVISKILPDNANLNSLALLEYYQPIINWLTTHNAQTNVKIGWNVTKRKIV